MRLGGVTEVAEVLGISRQGLAKLRERIDFPSPVATLAAGPVWDLDKIEIWNQSGMRRGPGRPSTTRRKSSFDTLGDWVNQVESESAQPTNMGGHSLLGERFEIIGPAIGAGGFADVFRAVDYKDNSIVALKVLREQNEQETIRRFRRELRLLEGLEHPNVVPVLAHGEDEAGRLWYAMPLAQGSLADEIKSFIGDEMATLDIMRQLCAGLAHVHEAGVLHRDLKPGNVLQIRPGTWAIADFGLARDFDRMTTALTTTLDGFGTSAYTAPEQWQDAKSADVAADIYSLGKILQELVTGIFPIGNSVPRGVFRPIIQKAIKSEPSQRQIDATDFLEALEEAATASRLGGETIEGVIERLWDRVAEERLDKGALQDFVGVIMDANKVPEINDQLIELIPRLSSSAIKWLWDRDPEGFQELLARYNEQVVRRNNLAFSFCDTIANFYNRVLIVIGDTNLLRLAVAGLAELGARHNRWHVRNVLIGILQRLRTTEEAMVALDGLRDANPPAVQWSLGEFAVRSLHPVIREGMVEILERAAES